MESLLRVAELNNTGASMLVAARDRDAFRTLQTALTIMEQEMLVPLEFLALQTPDLGKRFVGIEAFHPEDEVVIVSDAGEVYQGAAAWIMVMYALREFRSWAFTMASPNLMPLARKLVHAVSENRLKISAFFGATPKMVKTLEAIPDKPRCDFEPPPLPPSSRRSWAKVRS